MESNWETYDILATIGAIGSGKDFTCKKLKSLGFSQVDFKDAMLEAVWTLLNWQPKNQKEYETFKVSTFSNSFFNISFTGRQLLERFGTECIRKSLNLESLWVDKWKEFAGSLLEGFKKVSVGDCRFKNEVEGIISLGETLNKRVGFIFCDFKSTRYDNSGNHPSRLLAQYLVSLGYKDQDIIEAEEMRQNLINFG